MGQTQNLFINFNMFHFSAESLAAPLLGILEAGSHCSSFLRYFIIYLFLRVASLARKFNIKPTFSASAIPSYFFHGTYCCLSHYIFIFFILCLYHCNTNLMKGRIWAWMISHCIISTSLIHFAPAQGKASWLIFFNENKWTNITQI